MTGRAPSRARSPCAGARRGRGHRTPPTSTSKPPSRRIRNRRRARGSRQARSGRCGHPSRSIVSERTRISNAAWEPTRRHRGEEAERRLATASPAISASWRKSGSSSEARRFGPHGIRLGHQRRARMEVLAGVVAGGSNKEIAADLGVTERTVERATSGTCSCATTFRTGIELANLSGLRVDLRPADSIPPATLANLTTLSPCAPYISHSPSGTDGTRRWLPPPSHQSSLSTWCHTPRSRNQLAMRSARRTSLGSRRRRWRHRFGPEGAPAVLPLVVLLREDRPDC